MNLSDHLKFQTSILTVISWEAAGEEECWETDQKLFIRWNTRKGVSSQKTAKSHEDKKALEV